MLVEIGAAFLFVRAGVTAEPREDHAHYLKSWIGVLKADNPASFTAASQAHVSPQAPCPVNFIVAGSSWSLDESGLVC